MYDSLLSSNELDITNPFSQDFSTKVEFVVHSNWEEHCVECSPPYCYNNCPLYMARSDKRCIRLLNGIQIVRSIDGPMGYGIKCEFRKWAKLETYFSGVWRSIEQERSEDKMYRRWGRFAVTLSKIMGAMGWRYSPYAIVDGIRRHQFSRTFSQPTADMDTLLIDCYLDKKEDVSLLVQMDKDTIIYSQVHVLKPGENTIRVSLKGKAEMGMRVFISPLGDSDTILYFRCLDFVKEKETEKLKVGEEPAPIVKVVAWDLDNTLWNGTLVNDPNVQLNKVAIEVVKELDRRGILNTICSKNDSDAAIAKLKEFHIDDYFLYPAINWGQKSENLKAVAKQLNLGINAFAFIDDNIREREEVSSSLPCVRVFSETEIPYVLQHKAFQTPVTEVSRKRRQLYLEDSKRKTLEATYSDNYDEYLRSLEMRLVVENISESNKNRCFELLSRSNQLNLSTNRYTIEEFERLLKNKDMECFAFRVIDKFGDYGIIGFLSVLITSPRSQIVDLVISCRIAKKKVEAAIVRSLKNRLLQLGVESIAANLIVTKKNGPLVGVFMDLPFEKKEEDEKHILYELPSITKIKDDEIIDITYEMA